MTWVVIGVDPGKSGAVAALYPDGLAIAVMCDTGDPAQICTAIGQCLRNGAKAYAGVEKVASMPGQGVASSFKFGASFGMPRGVLQAWQVSTTLVTPQTWTKRAFRGRHKPRDKAERKEAARSAARERWPSVDMSLKKHQAIAEALWIAQVIKEQEGLS